jgi:hypothetical protein
MSFTSDNILECLSKSDYPLLNANYDIAAVRVTGFCSQENWAITYELLIDYPSSDGIGLMLMVYGPGAIVEQGFRTPCLHTPFAWERREGQDDDLDGDELDDIDYSLIPPILEVDVRKQQILIHSKDVVRRNNTQTFAFAFDLLNHLIDIYEEELYSTDKELRLYVDRNLTKLVQFDNWYHEDNWQNGGVGAGVWEGDKFHIPSYTLAVKVIAQILETRNFDLYRSQAVEDLGFDWTFFGEDI